jgi:hypothetical protein
VISGDSKAVRKGGGVFALLLGQPIQASAVRFSRFISSGTSSADPRSLGLMLGLRGPAMVW